MAKQKYTQQQVIQALKDTRGMVYIAADRLGCKAKTIYNYRDRYPDVAAEMEQQDGRLNDIAELKLAQAVDRGEPWAVQFRLRTKGRRRGYGDAMELTGKDGGPVQHKHEITHDLTRLSAAELDTLESLVAKATGDAASGA